MSIAAYNNNRELHGSRLSAEFKQRKKEQYVISEEHVGTGCTGCVCC